MAMLKITDIDEKEIKLPHIACHTVYIGTTRGQLAVELFEREGDEGTITIRGIDGVLQVLPSASNAIRIGVIQR